MKPVSIHIITYAPTIFSHCQHCELTFQEMGIGERLRRVEAAEALPADLALEFQAVSDWVHQLLQRHGPRLRIDVLDAASIGGFIASLRYRAGRYPAVIVDGHLAQTGLDFGTLDRLIDQKVLAARSPLATPSP